MKLLIQALVAVTSLVASACDPPARAAPVPDRVAMVGDSNLTLSHGFGGDLRGADIDGKVNPGWEPRNVIPRVQSDVANAATSPSVLVVALGQNMGDVYGATEYNELVTLTYAPHEDTCVVFMLPYVHPDLPEAWRVNLTDVIADMMYLSEVRPDTHVVDWADVAVAHPEYIVADHIHLNAWVGLPTPAPAAVAYLDLIWTGVEQCGS